MRSKRYEKDSMAKPSPPRPGRPTRASRTGRPIMALLDLLGRRWQLRILWELRADQPLRFRALQEAAGVSPSVLNTRLSETIEAGIVALTEDGYTLTAEGRTLLEAFMPLHVWAERWAKRTQQ
jgi:DNA-binding HxlR family transcriptional regulator